MFSQFKKVQFPIWKYLNQPVFDPYIKTVLNPRVFWRIHSIELLERCLMQDVTSYDGRRD
ncbi:hypothetical protein [Leptothermofonsia sp. ETS-13]|uniref:hypothetical protein n=1 Tax=Leptothermofonsia sp. ETS-13 TaxID=3035696 RepID=UPI003BA1A879